MIYSSRPGSMQPARANNIQSAGSITHATGRTRSTGLEGRNAKRGDRDYLRRSFFVRTLSFTIGRLAVEEMRALLRRRRRSNRASAEKKWRMIQAPPVAAMTPRIVSTMGLPEFTEVYLTHDAEM